MTVAAGPAASQAPPAASLACRPIPELVLQCSGCRTVLSDSTEYVGTLTVGSSQFMVTSAVSSVAVDRIAQTHKLPSAAEHCTYYTACCSSCGSAVGRLYSACPDGLAALRNCFALDVAKCESFQLGSCGIRVAGGAEGTPGPQPPQQQPSGGGTMAARMESLEAELLKLQGMVLLQNEQLAQLPGYQMQSSEGEGLPMG